MTEWRQEKKQKKKLVLKILTTGPLKILIGIITPVRYRYTRMEESLIYGSIRRFAPIWRRQRNQCEKNGDRLSYNCNPNTLPQAHVLSLDQCLSEN